MEFNVSGDPNGYRDLIKEWRFHRDADGWKGMNQIQLQTRDGSLQIESIGEDPFMGADVEHRGGPMMLRFSAQTDVEGIGQSFWRTKDLQQPTGDRQANFLLRPGKAQL